MGKNYSDNWHSIKSTKYHTMKQMFDISAKLVSEQDEIYGVKTISEDSPQGEWDKMAELMMLNFAESGHPVFRATTPLSSGRLKGKGHGKLSMHYAADLETIETMFRIIVSANQLSLYGAIAEICVKSMKPFTKERRDPL